MVPDIKIKSVKINSKKSEFRKKFHTSRILTVENGASAWEHNSQKISLTFRTISYFIWKTGSIVAYLHGSFSKSFGNLSLYTIYISY